jgi:hypothetical protein
MLQIHFSMLQIHLNSSFIKEEGTHTAVSPWILYFRVYSNKRFLDYATATLEMTNHVSATIGMTKHVSAMLEMTNHVTEKTQ